MARLNDLTSEDLIIEILSRLPVISLMRFKCVSKSWCSLVQNPHFVAKHRQNYLRSASSDNLCILLRRRCPTTREEVLSLLTCDDKAQATHGGDDDFPNFLVKNVGLPYYEDTPDFKISGICDGIICFYNGDRVIIANPVIRQLKILPGSCICLPPNEDGYVEWKVNVVGFGYDPKANDYKVVRVWYSPNEDLLHRRVEVYTLSLDAWKEIDNFGLEVRIISYLPHFKRYWNGAYYWHGELFDSCADSYRGEAIVLFDLTCEVFRYINMPEPIITFYCLMEMNESLALFYYVREEKSFDVWTMEEFGVNGTWTKLLRIGPLWGVVTPLLFTKSDEILMEDSGQMVSYNLTTKEIKRLPVYGDEQEFQAWIYKQSLVNFNALGKYSIRKEYCFNLAFVIRNSLLRD